jgi:hypothetical protein
LNWRILVMLFRCSRSFPCLMAFLWLAASPAFSQVSDTTPPHLAAFSGAPGSVDVTAANQTVNFSAHVTDDLSGISFAEVAVTSPSGKQREVGFGVPQSGVACPSQPFAFCDATFAIAVVIPRYSEPGTWSVSVFLSDRVGNSATLATSVLAAAGFSSAFTVNDSDPDLQAPALTGVTMSPASVDVSAGGGHDHGRS